jgi:hypothetical protein
MFVILVIMSVPAVAALAFLVYDHIRHKRRCRSLQLQSGTNRQDMKKPRCIVVGAGPGGLSMAENALRKGLDVVVVEQENSIGGLWCKGSKKLYRSLRCNVPKQYMTLRELGPFESHSSYQSPAEVREYLEMYAERFCLIERIRFGLTVKKIEKTSGEWRVSCLDSHGALSVLVADFVVLAIGQTSRPHSPPLPGIESFTGAMFHSSDYHDPSKLSEKTVLVVGSRSSGSDIAQDLSYSAQTVLSVNRSRTAIFPRFMFGRSFVDVVFSKLALHVPVLQKLLIFIMATASGFRTGFQWSSGDASGLNRYERKSDVFPSRFIADSCDLAMRCAVGAVSVVGPVKSIRGCQIEFACGSKKNIDAIVLATGFERDFSSPLYSIIPGRSEKISLFDFTFVPGEPSLAFVLQQHPSGTHWAVISAQTDYIAKIFAGELLLPELSYQRKHALDIGRVQGSVDSMAGDEIRRYRGRTGIHAPSLLDLLRSLVFDTRSALAYLRSSDWGHAVTVEEAVHFQETHFPIL